MPIKELLKPFVEVADTVFSILKKFVSHIRILSV